MKGFQIFGYAVRQVFRNLQGALWVSALPTLLCIGALYTLNLKFLLIPLQANLVLERDLLPLPKVGLLLLFYFLMCLWVAVNWHRYILRDDPVGAGLPPIRTSRLRSYLVASLLVAICVTLPVVFVYALGMSLLFALATVTGNPSGLIVAAGIGFISAAIPAVIALRASIFLPGVAVGREISMSDGWTAANEQILPLTIVVICSGSIFFAVDLIGATKLFYPTAALGMLWQFFALWFKTMLGISILTTLYGHYVEKRPLV